MQVGINREGRAGYRLKSASNYKYNARVRGVTISVTIQEIESIDPEVLQVITQ